MKVKLVELKTAFPDGLEIGKIYEVREHCDTGFFVNCDNNEGSAFIYSSECEVVEG